MRVCFFLNSLMALLVLGSASITAQQVNSPESSLTFNQFTGKAFPVQAMAGELDPSLIVVEGAPDASYQVRIGNYVANGTGSAAGGGAALAQIVSAQLNTKIATPAYTGISHINPSKVLLSFAGNLDSSGRAIIIVPRDSFQENSKLAIQARVGGFYSGATQFNVVRTLSSPPLLTMGNGSIANILGPINAITANVITVGNLEYQITANTIFGNSPFEDLEVGSWVDMVGEVTAAGGLTAVEVNEEDADNEVRIRARIQGIGPAGFCLLNVSVFTSNASEFVDWETGAPLAYSDLELAMPVEIRIPVGTEGFAHVSSCELNVEIEPEPEPEDEPENEDEDPAPPFCS